MPEPEKALCEIDRVLKPGGILIAPNFVEHKTGLGSRIWSRILQIAGIKFEHQWTAKEYVEFLSANGFKAVYEKERPARITLYYTECKRKNEL